MRYGLLTQQSVSYDNNAVQARAFHGIAIVRLKPTTSYSAGWTKGVATLPAAFTPLHAPNVNDIPEAALVCTDDAKSSGIISVNILGRVDVYNPNSTSKVFGGCIVYVTAQ